MQNSITISELPAIIELDGTQPAEFIDYYLAHKEEINKSLLRHGAVKFKGVLIDSIASFNQVVSAISDKFLSYIDGTSPRTKLSGNIYTSTEYDQTMKITMHNENSYSARWPDKLFLSCLIPADTGGETLLADSREMLNKMNQDVVSEIRTKGVIYIRNLHGGHGMGLSWQQAFETNDPLTLEEYCKRSSIALKWKDDNGVRLEQASKGIIRHRYTKEEVWFNQIDQFHPFQLGTDLYQAMMEIYDSPEDFPTYVNFGDGTPIGEDIIREVLNTAAEITVAPAWKKNELLIIDNVLVSHGRNPYSGERKVLLSMSE